MRLIEKNVALGAILLAAAVLFAAEWYASYEKAVDAIGNEKWREALAQLNDAVANKSDSKANAKTYGMRFIDYFPYLYRGIAHYHLGDYARALEDLKKEERAGELAKANKDRDAQQKLRQYLNLLDQQNKPAEEKKPVEKPAVPQRPPAQLLFDDGVALYNQKSYAEARDKFTAALRANPSHPQAAAYLKMTDDELGKARAMEEKQRQLTQEFSDGLNLYKAKNFDAAEIKFKKVLSLEASHGEAKNYLALIDRERKKAASVAAPEPVVAEDKPATTNGNSEFDDAVALFESGDYKRAKARLLSLNSGQANDFLKRITEAEQQMARGISEYFEGNYHQAIAELSDCAESYSHSASVQAFLACAFASKYYLEGADDKMLERAREHFGKLKELDSSYQFDDRFISPRIIELFASE